MTNSIAIIRMKDVKTLLKEIRQVDAFDNRSFFRFRAPVTSRYSVSVIRTDHSYGNKKGLFEIALIDPKTDDVTFNDNFFNGDVFVLFLLCKIIKQFGCRFYSHIGG